ncbi:hypothetical protein E4T47_08461 [Aureobasidium subglaciale]|nr:hypothetical protein E4T47_08461 [Aureobasidium subglaciale]
MSSLYVFSLRKLIRATIVSSVFLLFACRSHGKGSVSNTTMAKRSSKHHHKCIPIPGLEDVLVILKTGATESPTKLPVHFRTTLKFMPNYVVYSDIEESVDGHSVVDALDTVSNVYRINNSDFELYTRLKKDGRASSNPQELQQWSSVQNSGAGMIDNPAWTLDKWKFLPLIDKALQHRSDANWYFFVEADTAILWSNLAEWLAKFDKTQPYYLGNQQQIGDVVFGHGGSGEIMVSQSGQLPSHEIEAVWHLEQQLLGRNESCSLRYKDVFERFVLPHLQPSKDDWDNLSAEHVDLQAGVDLFEACKDECMRREKCLQFSVKEKSCHASSDVKSGRPFQASSGTISQSGWILDRIDAFVRDMEACGGDQEWALKCTSRLQ